MRTRAVRTWPTSPDNWKHRTPLCARHGWEPDFCTNLLRGKFRYSFSTTEVTRAVESCFVPEDAAGETPCVIGLEPANATSRRMFPPQDVWRPPWTWMPGLASSGLALTSLYEGDQHEGRTRFVEAIEHQLTSPFSLTSWIDRVPDSLCL